MYGHGTYGESTPGGHATYQKSQPGEYGKCIRSQPGGQGKYEKIISRIERTYENQFPEDKENINNQY